MRGSVMAGQPRGIALTIGINRVDPGFYAGAPALAGCVNDANDVAAIARSQHFAVMPSLLDEGATAAALEGAIAEAASKLDPGDLFLLHYSGHGMDQGAFDLYGDHNTSWCLYDGPYVDDRLFDSWFKFQPGVRIVVLSDSCHSGTAVREILRQRAVQARERSMEAPIPLPRGLSPEVQEATVRRNEDYFRKLRRVFAKSDSRQEDASSRRRVVASSRKEPPVAVLLLAACRDDETAGDLARNGLFTGSLLQAWDRGRFRGDYDSFLAAVAREVGRRSSHQTPQLFSIGDPLLAGNLAAMPPFRI